MQILVAMRPINIRGSLIDKNGTKLSKKQASKLLLNKKSIILYFATHTTQGPVLEILRNFLCEDSLQSRNCFLIYCCIDKCLTSFNDATSEANLSAVVPFGDKRINSWMNELKIDSRLESVVLVSPTGQFENHCTGPQISSVQDIFLTPIDEPQDDINECESRSTCRSNEDVENIEDKTAADNMKYSHRKGNTFRKNTLSNMKGKKAFFKESFDVLERHDTIPVWSYDWKRLVYLGMGTEYGLYRKDMPHYGCAPDGAVHRNYKHDSYYRQDYKNKRTKEYKRYHGL